MEMRKTDYCRKMDGAGRIVVPSNLRDYLHMAEGDIMDFYIFETDGRTFLAVECINLESEVERAKRILRENGIEI